MLGYGPELLPAIRVERFVERPDGIDLAPEPLYGQAKAPPLLAA